MENWKDVWYIFTNLPWNFKNIYLLGWIYHYNIVKLWGNSCLEWCFLTFCLLCPFPILNLFFILSSYILPTSGTPPLLIPIYTITLSWQFLLAPKNVFSPSESCILHHHFLCQFSQSHWSLLLVIICELLSLSSTCTFALSRSFFGSVFRLNLLPTFFQLRPMRLSKREKYSAGIIALWFRTGSGPPLSYLRRLITLCIIGHFSRREVKFLWLHLHCINTHNTIAR